MTTSRNMGDGEQPDHAHEHYDDPHGDLDQQHAHVHAHCGHGSEVAGVAHPTTTRRVLGLLAY